MTSGISSNQSQADFNKLISARLLLNNIRRHKALIIVTAIVLFFARPVVQIIALMNYYNNIAGAFRNVTLYQHAYRNAQDTAAFVTAAALVLAVFIGLSVTSHLHNRKAAIFYASIPVKRLSLFATQYLSGLAYFIPSFAVSYLLSLAIMPFRGAMIVNTWFYLGALFFFLLIYSFIILCGNISGTLMNSLLAAVYFCAVLPALFMTAVSFADLFYRFTNVFAMTQGPAWSFIYYPVIAYFPVAFLAYYRLSVAHCILMLVLAAAMTCLAYLFNKKARTENAEKPFYFTKFLAVLKYSTLAVLVIIAGMLFYMASGGNFAFLIIGILAGGFLAFMLVNFIIYKSIREVFKGARRFLIFAAAASVLAGLVSLDAFGIDRHIPDAERVREISYARWWSDRFSVDLPPQRHYRGTFWQSPNIVRIRDSETIRLVNNVFEAALRSDRRARANTDYHMHAVQREYLPLRERSGAINYRMQNGRLWAKDLNVHLAFSNQPDLDAFLSALRELRDSPGYRQAFYYPLTDAGSMREILDESTGFMLTLRRGDIRVFDAAGLHREEIEALVAVLNADIAALDMGSFARQYNLEIAFMQPHRGATINIALNDRCFDLTLDFLFDHLAR